MKKQIPNILTLFRMVLVIVLIVFATTLNKDLVEDNKFSFESVVILVIFLVASFTDFLDGFLARRWHVVSNFGKLMDPIADKLLVTSTLLIYFGFDKIPFIIVALFIARDILVDGLRMLALDKHIVISASILGKAKTVLQIVALSVVIINFSNTWSLALLIIACVIALLGMLEYYYKFIRKMSNEKR